LSDQAARTHGYPIGIIGCGNIFERYVTGLRKLGGVEIAWCADLDVPLAEKMAAKLGIPGSGSPTDALGDEFGYAGLVVNLTPPAAHAKVAQTALLAGKHVYIEKPLADTPAAAAEVLSLAARRGLQVGGAPDWILSSTAQVAREVIDTGRIGQPVAVSAFISHSRVEQWHPSPGIFFQHGAGPVLDLGPYYISALIYWLGPIAEVAALQQTGLPERRVTAPNRLVDSVPVEVATHACALLRFESGPVGTLTASFEAWERSMPFIEIYGSDGTLSMPMPHERDGEVRIKLHSDADWTVVPTPARPYARGIGVVEMAQAIQDARSPKASGAAAYHVLEVLTAIETSSVERKFVPLGVSS
jgi:predicted dehydrogenase